MKKLCLALILLLTGCAHKCPSPVTIVPSSYGSQADFKRDEFNRYQMRELNKKSIRELAEELKKIERAIEMKVIDADDK